MQTRRDCRSMRWTVAKFTPSWVLICWIVLPSPCTSRMDRRWGGCRTLRGGTSRHRFAARLKRSRTRNKVASLCPVSAFHRRTFSDQDPDWALIRAAAASCSFRRLSFSAGSSFPTIRLTVATVAPVFRAISATERPSARSCRISSTGISLRHVGAEVTSSENRLASR